MIDKLLATTPHKPGCYLMKDKNGCVIYRLSSYFKKSYIGKMVVLVIDITTFEKNEYNFLN